MQPPQRRAPGWLYATHIHRTRLGPLRRQHTTCCCCCCAFLDSTSVTTTGRRFAAAAAQHTQWICSCCLLLLLPVPLRLYALLLGCIALWLLYAGTCYRLLLLLLWCGEALRHDCVHKVCQHRAAAVWLLHLNSPAAAVHLTPHPRQPYSTQSQAHKRHGDISTDRARAQWD